MFLRVQLGDFWSLFGHFLGSNLTPFWPLFGLFFTPILVLFCHFLIILEDFVSDKNSRRQIHCEFVGRAVSRAKLSRSFSRGVFWGVFPNSLTFCHLLKIWVTNSLTFCHFLKIWVTNLWLKRSPKTPNHPKITPNHPKMGHFGVIWGSKRGRFVLLEHARVTPHSHPHPSTTLGDHFWGLFWGLTFSQFLSFFVFSFLRIFSVFENFLVFEKNPQKWFWGPILTTFWSLFGLLKNGGCHFWLKLFHPLWPSLVSHSTSCFSSPSKTPKLTKNGPKWETPPQSKFYPLFGPFFVTFWWF